MLGLTKMSALATARPSSSPDRLPVSRAFASRFASQGRSGPSPTISGRIATQFSGQSQAQSILAATRDAHRRNRNERSRRLERRRIRGRRIDPDVGAAAFEIRHQAVQRLVGAVAKIVVVAGKQRDPSWHIEYRRGGKRSGSPERAKGIEHGDTLIFAEGASCDIDWDQDLDRGSTGLRGLAYVSLTDRSPREAPRNRRAQSRAER